MLNECYKISYAIYVSLLFLPHIITIVLLGPVNPNQCTGCLFIFRFFTCTFILFRFTHVTTTEITSLISNLLENILKNLKLKVTHCSFTMPKWTHVEREKAIGMLQASVMPSVIAQQFRWHAMMIERPRKRF